MTCRISRAVLVCAAGVLASPAQAQEASDGTSVEFLIGNAWSLPVPLSLHGDSSNLRLRPRYSTRPFRDAPYYSIRLAHVENRRGFEVEMIHHKLYLENPVPPIDRLEITHGYNMPMLNVTGPVNSWQFRIGIGLVIGHAEGLIAGRDIDRGYRLAGASMQVALGRRYALNDGDIVMTATPEVKITGAFARFHFSPDVLTVPNIAIHALAGLGIQQRMR